MPSLHTFAAPRGMRARRSHCAVLAALLAGLLSAFSCSDAVDVSPAVERPLTAAEEQRMEAALAKLLVADYAGAAPLLEEALAERPAYGRAELYLGICEQKSKRYAKARPHFEAALQRAPFEKQETAHYWLGWCLYYLGEPEPAQAAFLRHLELDPNEGDSHFGAGLVDLDQGRLDAALQRFRTSIELHEAVQASGGADRRADIAKAHARIADVHLERDELEPARDELLACVTLHPAHYAAFHKLSEVLVQLGDPAGADRARDLHEQWKAYAAAQQQ